MEECNLKLMAEVGQCKERLTSLANEVTALEESAAVKSSQILDSISQVAGSKATALIREGYHTISSEIYSFASKREKVNQLKERINFEDSMFSTLKQLIIDMNSLIRNLDDSDENLNKIDSLPGNEFPLNSSKETEKSVLLLQEAEKKQLAVSIHDNFVQNLANMVMKIDFAKKLITRSPEEAQLELLTLRKEMQNLLDFTRTIIFELSPMSMVDLGFVPTIERFVQSVNLTAPFKIRLEVAGTQYSISDLNSIVLFRIVQDSITNVSAHSCAKKVIIEIDYSNTSLLLLTISDDGIGFDVSRLSDFARMGHIGIHKMKSRIDLLDGHYNIEAQPGEGTKVKVTVPVGS